MYVWNYVHFVSKVKAIFEIFWFCVCVCERERERERESAREGIKWRALENLQGPA
jgi:hypothetical protein